MGLTDFPNGITAFGNLVAPSYGFGIGNVYYVCQAANSVVYHDMKLKYAGEIYENDHSSILHTDIQSALTATVANREDFVIVCTDGSDYDLEAALTMTKKGVHLIAPGGMGRGGLGSNAVRIHQTGAGLACITSTGDCIEAAGFFFKGAVDSPIVELSSARWHNFIHDNFCGGAVSSGAAIHIIGGTGHVYQCTIANNYVMAGYGPAAQTISSCIGFPSASSGRNLIIGNYVVTGAQVIVTAGILTKGANDMVVNNILHESLATGLGAGDFTEAWDGHTSTVYIGNRMLMTTPNESGGTGNKSHTDNWSSTSGNTIIEGS